MEINRHIDGLRLGMVASLLIFSVAWSGYAFSQADSVVVPCDVTPGKGNLNIYVDSVKAAGTLSTAVFILQPHGRYVLIDSIVVPASEHLTIISLEPGTTQETAPPQILWDSSAALGNYFFVCYGDLTLKNVWLFSANVKGDRTFSCIIFNNDPSDLDGRRCDFDGVILDYFPLAGPAGGTVTVNCKDFKGFFRNSYWKNNTDDHFRYYGRAVSFPFASTGLYGDSVVFENCTFANIGYVLMQEGGEYFDYVKFNHCTFLNVVMYSLEAGWWNRISVTNCVFVNTHMMGYTGSETAWAGEPYGGTLRIDSLNSLFSGTVYTFPFAEAERRILFTNSSYYIEEWLSAWMHDCPGSVYKISHGDTSEVPNPQPMMSPGTLTFFDSTSNGQKAFPYMNRAHLYDSTNPAFLLPPTDTSKIQLFLEHKWFDSQDQHWAWKPENSINGTWPLEENLAYTNPVLLNAGMSGFPLGDLYRWWPDKYQQWKVQATAEGLRINTWLAIGMDPGGVDAVPGPPNDAFPLNYSLSQNYPNPFNPATRITYSIPKNGHISLKVFNLLGQEVAVLFNGFRHAGTYVAEFDLHGLPSGVCLCRLDAGNFTDTKKMMLLR